MIKEYTYRLPISLFFIGIIGVALTVLFGSMISVGEIWISIIFGILTLITGIVGCLSLYTIYINLDIKNLKISPQYIELPLPHKKYDKISFEDINEVQIVSNGQGKLIEIYTKNNKAYLIDEKWMKKKDFIEVSNRLNDWKM